MQPLLRTGALLFLVVTAGAFWPRPADVEANPLTGIASVAAGVEHTCALTTSGGALCWGANGSGQIGDGTALDRSVAVPVVGLEGGVAAIGAGLEHTCALTAGGGVQCWGANEVGQLGDGTTDDSAVPVDVCADEECLTPLSGVAAIAVGGLHTCALTTGGGLKCWGWNRYGQMGNGTTSGLGGNPAPEDVVGMTSGVDTVEAGGVHTCALLTAGGLKCWGWNRFGQVGDGQACQTVCIVPAAVSGLGTGVVAFGAGNDHTCALTSGGDVVCWGLNDTSQLGATSADECGVQPLVFDCSLTPIVVSGLSGEIDAVAGGDDHSCALGTTGGVQCWGGNDSGQLGDGLVCGATCAPTAVAGLSAGAIDAGGNHTCALVGAGGVQCWGANAGGQLGDGTASDHGTPVEALGLGGAPDSDGDGCSDSAELGAVAALGGLRSPKRFWDFFDTPDAGNARDGSVSVGDLFRVVARFGSSGDAKMDPLSAPPAAPGYHTAFDRSAPGQGAEAWDLGPPNGSIDVGDIFFAAAQFGHSCL